MGQGGLPHISFSTDSGRDWRQEKRCPFARIWEDLLIPESGRSPSEGNGNPLQSSCLENSMDRGARQATCSPWGCKESDITETLALTVYLSHWRCILWTQTRTHKHLKVTLTQRRELKGKNIHTQTRETHFRRHIKWKNVGKEKVHRAQDLSFLSYTANSHWLSNFT